MPEPPAEFVALQVSRLNEALLVAYSAMSGANLRAVDLVVKIVRELDRYHGFSAADRRVPAPRLQPEERLALDPQLASRLETAPQAFEKARIRARKWHGRGRPGARRMRRRSAAKLPSSFLETPAQSLSHSTRR